MPVSSRAPPSFRVCAFGPRGPLERGVKLTVEAAAVGRTKFTWRNLLVPMRMHPSISVVRVLGLRDNIRRRRRKRFLAR
jgi:hypothetical protein